MTRRGLIEAHAHLPELGQGLGIPSLEGCTDLAGALDAIARAADGKGGDEWVLAWGARIDAWREARWPTRGELARASGGRPCCVLAFDHHAACACERAMRLGGLSDDSPDPEGGVLVRDGAGRATGVLLESAAWRVWNAAPEPSGPERVEHVRLACARLASLGYEGVHDLRSPAWLPEALEQLEGRGELPLRVGMYAPFEESRWWLERGERRRGRVELLGFKMFADGTLNSRTAWMREPYADGLAGLERGKALLGVAEIASALRVCRDAGLGLAVHAIGDAAVDCVLDGVEACAREGAARGVRIEHAEVLGEGSAARMAELGVVASVQPCHLLADVEALSRGLGHRLDRVLPLREMIDAGLAPGRGLVFGSDAPIMPADPELSVRAATGRARAVDGRVIGAGQAITEEEAWACFGSTSLGRDL